MNNEVLVGLNSTRVASMFLEVVVGLDTTRVSQLYIEALVGGVPPAYIDVHSIAPEILVGFQNTRVHYIMAEALVGPRTFDYDVDFIGRQLQKHPAHTGRAGVFIGRKKVISKRRRRGR